MQPRHLILVACFIPLVTFTGCSSSSDKLPDLGTVRGTVTLDGQPLDKASVEFFPVDGRPSFGLTDETGSYELSFDPAHKGAAVGQHSVRITTRLRPADDLVDKVPEKYNEKTTLKAKVLDGDNEFNYALKSK